jgi:phage repressor protein C with HTH and peptisase S24 domain
MGVGKQVREARLARGWTQVQLAETAGCKQADVQRIETGEVRNSKYLTPILKILQISETTQATIPVVGYIGAGAEVFAIDDHAKGDGFDEVPAPPGMLNGIALIIRGDSMAPKYEDGEVIYIEKTLHAIDSLIGAICYVQLADGRCYLKKLQHGSRPGTFNLISSNGPAILDVVVERAYPIAFTRPKYRNTK